jgi:hypothetical protein
VNKLIVGLLAAMLALSPVLVAAGEFPVEATPGNSDPQIYLIKKIFDICNPTNLNTQSSPMTPGEAYGASGSTPYGDQTIQYGGCKDSEGELRLHQYAFTGEKILELVVVRDLNGGIDILGADMVVDGYPEAKCDDVTNIFYSNGQVVKYTWFGHEVYDPIMGTGLLAEIPPAKGPADEAGLDPAFDRLYECILTVEPSWYGESTVSVIGFDQAGAQTPDGGILQQWFFNPAVILDLYTNDGAPSVWYEDGVPGQTVYSGNKLKVANLAEGAVDLLVFIAADDLTDPSHTAAKCPISNVLDVEKYMEYRCKIGTMADNEWNTITNKDTKLECDETFALDPTDEFGDEQICYGAKSVVTEYLPMLMNQHEAECAFRLTYPVPCVGSFSEGLLHIIVRTI